MSLHFPIGLPCSGDRFCPARFCLGRDLHENGTTVLPYVIHMGSWRCRRQDKWRLGQSMANAFANAGVGHASRICACYLGSSQDAGPRVQSIEPQITQSHLRRPPTRLEACFTYRRGSPTCWKQPLPLELPAAPWPPDHGMAGNHKWACKRLRDRPRCGLEHLEQKVLFEVYINSRIRHPTYISSSCSC